MVYRPKLDQKLCFVLMPFGHPFDTNYHKVIKPAAANAGLEAVRSDEIYSTKPIIQDIWARIWQAKVVIAEVTGKNPNVNYELGLCHALGIPTIIIAKNIDDVPFDYRHRRCIIYRVDDTDWGEKLRSDLSNTIQVVMGDATSSDELGWPYDTSLLKDSNSGSALIATGDSRKSVVRGAAIVRDTIASAFGPLGEGVAVSRPHERSIPSRRGVEIVQAIKSANPLEEKGIEELRGVASNMRGFTGDGTKLAVILAAGLMVKGQELIDQGNHPKAVLDAFQNAVERVLANLLSLSEVIKGPSLLGIARTAAHGDTRLAGLVVEALKKVGKDGVVGIESANIPESILELREGMRFARGFLSENFITDSSRQECMLEDCLILIHEKKITSMKEMLQILELVAKSGRGLLVIAEDVEGEALATLVLNKMRGVLRCVAVRSPGYADRRRQQLDDIAILTGARVLTAELGRFLATATLDDLGKAKKVIVTKDETSIIDGGGSSADIEERVRAIRNQIDNMPSAIEQMKLQERLAMLVGGIAILKAGGLTAADVANERYKLESAFDSCRTAIEHGYLPGGGIALLRAGISLEDWAASKELEISVKQAIANILESPLRHLVENAKRSPTQIVAEIRKQNSPNLGFNAEADKLQDLVEQGVLDPTKLVEMALKVAFSHARSVLQTGAWDISGSSSGSNQN